MMRRLFLILLCSVLMAQGTNTVSVGASMTGTGQTITGNLVIPLSPSTLTWSCTPAVLAKGSSVSCTPLLDSPVPDGMTGTVSLGIPPTGFTVTPAAVTIGAGAMTGPPVTVTRQ